MSEIDIDLLAPNPWNTNIVTPENEMKIEASIKRLGFFRPVIVRTLEDGSLQILGGEHRWQVARKLGYDTIPVVNLGTIDDLKAKEIGLVDNGRYGEDDALQLAELLKEMGNPETLTEFLPYSGDDLESLFAAGSISLDDLDIDDDSHKIDELPLPKTAQTHQIMRFKIPVGDAPFVQKRIETVMKSQGFSDDDSLMNAGHALVVLLKGAA
ncbi:ParB/RepB/Spo0J family partition protein [Methyloversatilis sp.]|uniref:ParB/RepB/Spo0J family partition protein n=1 Tax=Methyloversatilis sp. TaxID=2569862 RepID=UPI0035AFA1F9